MSGLDRILNNVDAALRTTLTVAGAAARANPGANTPSASLSQSDARKSVGLMRINHAGEVAAQGLYRGHAAVVRDRALAFKLDQAASEEADHLGWCADRLAELGAAPSRLNPIWYSGAFALGAASGALGDRWSLGFIAETERQVVKHLNDHLRKLPVEDGRSRAILEQMRDEEAHHGETAELAGGAPLPGPVRRLMQLTARIMTKTAYWI